MKLNRVWIVAAAAAFMTGSLAVAGCSMSDDDDAATEQASVSGNQGDETSNTASDDLGVANYAFHGGAHGGGAHGGFAHGGFAHGAHGRGGYGHAGWGRGGRWGRDGRWGGWWRHDRRWWW